MDEIKRVVFRIPKTIQHKDARKLIGNLVKELNEKGSLTEFDIALLHRMSTAYDMYLTCVDVLNEKGMTMLNIKGETVKRPEANLLRENWSQFLELAKEFGLTVKSKNSLKSMQGYDNEKSPLEEYLETRNNGDKEIL